MPDQPVGPGWGCATGSRPVPWWARRTRCRWSRKGSMAGSSGWRHVTAAMEVGGEWIARPWDLVARNGAHLRARLRRGGRRSAYQPAPDGDGAGGAGRPAVDPRDGPDRSVYGLRHDQRADHPGPERLGPAVHADRGPVLDRRRDAALPGQPPRLRDDRAATAGSAARSRPRSSTATPTSTTKGSWGTPTSASGSIWVRSRPTATCGTTTARCTSRCRATRSRPARRRSAASSATIPGPAWAACSTRARRSA